jgi:glyoxylase-like metal-dependent hydrolase (beta-lactamase superfamily II)
MGYMVKRTAISHLQANVYVIHDPMFPLYLIHGERNLLIDCSILAKAPEITSKLDTFLRNEKIDLVLLTHSHYDHTGACSHLQEKYGFEIIASHRTKEILENDKAIAFIDDLNQQFKKILNDQSISNFSKPKNIHGIDENEMIGLSMGQTIEVFETPGHTRCSLSFLLKPDNILFPGDAAGVVEKTGKIKPLFLSSYTQYEKSLKKLMTLKAVILALPHNHVVRGEEKILEFLSKALDETHKLKEEILAWLRKSDDFAMIAENILEREYDSPTIMGPREALLINVTAMVKSIYYEFVKIP